MTTKHTPELERAALRWGTAALNELAELKRDWDALLAACEAMRDLLSNSDVRFMICDGGRGHLGEQSLYHRTMNGARAAIAAARGEKGEQTK